jgi:hypothetical protein
MKNDSRIFEHPQDCSSSGSERGFGKEKVVCTFFFPHSLTPEQREDRVTSCQDIIAMADADELFFFDKIITVDETWCFACDPETKRQSSEWVGETSPRPKKLKFQRSRVMTMLIIFFRHSRRSAQRIHTGRKNNKCLILYRSNGSPPEAHSAGSSSCVLLSRFFFVVARKCARPQSCKCLPIFDTKKCYNPLSPP